MKTSYKITLLSSLANFVALVPSSLVMTVFYNNWESTRKAGYEVSLAEGSMIMIIVGFLLSLLAIPFQNWILNKGLAADGDSAVKYAIAWFVTQWAIAVIVTILLSPIYIFIFFSLLPIPCLIAVTPFQIAGAYVVWRNISHKYTNHKQEDAYLGVSQRTIVSGQKKNPIRRRFLKELVVIYGLIGLVALVIFAKSNARGNAAREAEMHSLEQETANHLKGK